MPKVFVLTPPLKATAPEDIKQERPLNGGVESSLAIASPMPKRRRRRDPVTAPVLVRHVVFERPETEGVQQPQVRIAPPTWDEANYSAACLVS